jgi:hypothetical protein
MVSGITIGSAPPSVLIPLQPRQFNSSLRLVVLCYPCKVHVRITQVVPLSVSENESLAASRN